MTTTDQERAQDQAKAQAALEGKPLGTWINEAITHHLRICKAEKP